MATIVRKYDPWAENLAINTIVPLITDALQRGRNAIQNKKTNLYRQQLQQYIDAQSNPSNLINGTAQPEGYNDNPYAAAFHKTNQPLQQFDMGTADIVPQQQQPPRIPTLMDYERAAAEIGANPRFSAWLSPDEQRNAMLGLYNASELLRNEQKQREAAAAFNQAMGLTGKTDALTSGLINGSIAPDTFAQALTGVKYGYPYQQPYTYNSGQTTFGYSFDPVTGAMYNRIAWANSLPPKEAADLADKQDEREEQNKQFWATHDEGVKQFRMKHEADIENARAKNAQINRELDIKNRAQTSIERQQMIDIAAADEKALNKQLEDLETKETKLDEKLRDAIAYGERPGESKARYEKELAEIRVNKAVINKQLRELRNKLQSNTPTVTQGNQGQPYSNFDNSDALGTRMIDGVNKQRKKPVTGHFGEDRKTHKHGGTDYPAPAGTPIKVDSEMGTNLRVKSVDLNPNNKSGFGCHVILEGERNGKKVRYTMAHMKEGSIKVVAGGTVKAGDILGGVGNTGNSHGNHLHLEVRVFNDKTGTWDKVDPDKFLSTHGSIQSSQPQQIGPWTDGSSQPTQVQTPTSPDVQAPVQPTQSSQPSTPDNDVIWVDADGEEASADAINSIYQNGKANGFSDAEIEEVINGMGYKKTQRPDKSAVTWVNKNGGTLSEKELNEVYQEGAKRGLSPQQVDQELINSGYRKWRPVTPKMDLRPSYMTGRI